MKKNIFYIIFFCFFSLTFAQETNSIFGVVVDDNSKESLIGANVYIQGTKIGTSTNNNGFYNLEKIPEGDYKIVASYIGYQDEIIQISILKQSKLEVNFSLKAKPIYFDKIVVTATRTEKSINEIYASVDLITKDKIENINAKNVADIIEKSSNVIIKRYGPVGGLNSVSIRGASSNHVLILFDGEVMNNAQIQLFDLSLLSASNIDRIEIYKGGNSALYGSSAIGGVVSIMSNLSSKSDRIGFVGSIGSFGYREYEAIFKRSFKNGLKIGLDIGKRQSRNDFTFNYNNKSFIKNNSDYNSKNILSKVEYKVNEKLEIELASNFTDSERGISGTDNFPTPNARQNDTLWNNSIKMKLNLKKAFGVESKVWNHFYTLSYQDNELKSNHKNNSFGIDIQLDYFLNLNTFFVFRYEFGRFLLKSTNTKNVLRDKNSVLVSGEKKLNFPILFDSFSIFPSIRYDHYSDFGSKFSPKFGLLLTKKLKIDFNVRFAYGENFNAPSFNDLYWSGAGGLGNPNLKPEKSRNFDYGIVLQTEIKKLTKLNFEINYFDMFTWDKIQWRPMASVWSPVNIYKTSTNGIETNFEFVNKFIQLNLNYVFQHPKNITKGSEFFNKILIYSPREIWNIFVSFKIEMLAFNISHKHISHRFYTEDNDTRYFLPSYNIFDFSISFESRIFELNTRLKFEVNNIFNKNYQVIAGYPLPGREYRIQLNIDLNRKE